MNNYNFCKNVSNASYCSALSFAADLRRSNCLLFNNTIFFSSSSKKNCDKVIPKASHILVSEEMEGSIFFLYHEEIVDCVSPDFSAS